MATKRNKAGYPGVYYIVGTSAKGKPERIYYIRYRKNGKLVEEKAGRQFKDDMTPARAASKRARRIEGEPSNQERREAEMAEKRRQDSRWIIDRLWEAYQKNNPNLKGLRSYKSNYKLYVGPNFGKREPKEILPLDIARVKNRLLKTRSPQSVKHVLELLRRIINFGVNHQLCDGIGFRIDMPKVDNIRTEDLSTDELNRLLEAIEADPHPQAGNIMKLVLYSGMRRGEIFKLKIQDIDFDRGFIHIDDPKGGKAQKIPLNPPARNLLLDIIENREGNSPYVFPGKDGGQRQTIAAQVRRIREAAGLPQDFRPLHGLRHVYASMLASSGQVDMYTLQKLLTHKDPQMTQRYAHLRDEALKDAALVAGSIIESASSDGGRPQITAVRKRR